MLFRTVVSLTFRVNLLMKGVVPAVWPVIVIVVSSAWVAPARWERIIKTAPTPINANAFIMRMFLKFLLIRSRSVSINIDRVQQKFSMARALFSFELVELKRSEIHDVN